MTSSPASRYSPHPIGVLPSLGHPPGLAGLQDQQQQQQRVQLGHASSMGMEAADLVAAQQRQQRLLAEAQAGTGTMLSQTAQPTGGGLTQQLHQAQGQGQDPLQSIVQQLLYLQHLDYILGGNQRGHM